MITCNHIALFSPSMAGGGAERVMLHLARGFSERRIAVDLVLAQAVGSYLAAVPSKVRIVNLRANRVLSSLPRLTSYLRRERPAAVLSTQNHANVIALLARSLSRAPTRLIVREANILRPPLVGEINIRERLMPYLVRHAYPWADGIVAVSEGVAVNLARNTGLARERIQVIYNPIMQNKLRKKAKELVEHMWFKPDEPPIILGAGRLVRQKDFPTLIRAFARVREQNRARLVILGEGDKRGELERLIRELNLLEDVSLPGFMENPHAYMARAAVYVLSSKWEGLPNTLIEAMSVGTPVVATDCESGPREILAGGEYGQLIPVGDTEALAKAITNVIQGRKVRRPPQEWLNTFSLDVCIKKYLRLMQCAVNE